MPLASADNIYDIFIEYDRFFHRDKIRQASQGQQQRPFSSCLSQSRSGCFITSVNATMLSSSKADQPSTTKNDAVCSRHRQYGCQVTSPQSSFFLKVAVKAVHNRGLIDFSTQSFTELHSEKLYPEHNNHCEGLNNSHSIFYKDVSAGYLSRCRDFQPYALALAWRWCRYQFKPWQLLLFSILRFSGFLKKTNQLIRVLTLQWLIQDQILNSRKLTEYSWSSHQLKLKLNKIIIKKQIDCYKYSDEKMFWMTERSVACCHSISTYINF